jgi:hypothetical protein
MALIVPLLSLTAREHQPVPLFSFPQHVLTQEPRRRKRISPNVAALLTERKSRSGGRPEKRSGPPLFQNLQSFA